MKKFSMITMVGLFAMASMVQAADRMRAGNYEMTTTRAGGTYSGKYCFSAEAANRSNGDAKTLKAKVEKSAAERHCTTKDFKVTGDAVSMTTVCSGGSVASVTTYHGDWFETVMTTHSGKGADVTRVKYRRLGDCP